MKNEGRTVIGCALHLPAEEPCYGFFASFAAAAAGAAAAGAAAFAAESDIAFIAALSIGAATAAGTAAAGAASGAFSPPHAASARTAAARVIRFMGKISCSELSEAQQ